MQFSKQTVGALALFLFSIPALATSVAALPVGEKEAAVAGNSANAAKASVPKVNGQKTTGAKVNGAKAKTPAKGNDSKAAAKAAAAKLTGENKKMYDQLSKYHQTAKKELADCTTKKGAAHCLARGANVGSKKTLTPAEIEKYTDEYYMALGSKLGACIKKEGKFEKCNTKLANANDDKKFEKRVDGAVEEHALGKR